MDGLPHLGHADELACEDTRVRAAAAQADGRSDGPGPEGNGQVPLQAWALPLTQGPRGFKALRPRAQSPAVMGQDMCAQGLGPGTGKQAGAGRHLSCTDEEGKTASHTPISLWFRSYRRSKGKFFFSIFFTTSSGSFRNWRRGHMDCHLSRREMGPSWSQLLPRCTHHTSECTLRLSHQVLSPSTPNPGPASSSLGLTCVCRSSCRGSGSCL